MFSVFCSLGEWWKKIRSRLGSRRGFRCECSSRFIPSLMDVFLNLVSIRTIHYFIIFHYYYHDHDYSMFMIVHL